MTVEREALAELVRLKDLKDEEARLRQRRIVAVKRDYNATHHVNQLREEYERCKPAAWAAARAALSQPVEQPSAEPVARRVTTEPLPAEIAPHMPPCWSVEVIADGEILISIGHDWMSGSRALEQADEQTIIGAAQHLLSFVGYGLPPSQFDPDAEPARNSAGETPTEHAHRWATELAASMARKFYPEVTQWEPLPDLLGVITQIDNMVTGLVRAPTAEAAPSAINMQRPTYTHSQMAAVLNSIEADAKKFGLEMTTDASGTVGLRAASLQLGKRRMRGGKSSTPAKPTFNYPGY